LYPLLIPETTRSGVHLRHRDIHTVGWRAIHFVHAIAQSFHPQRTTQRQRVPDRARLDVWRDDGDLSKVMQCRSERMDAVRVDAIVVGNQDSGHRGTAGGKRLDYINESLQ
jgi:hypothetical protein